MLGVGEMSVPRVLKVLTVVITITTTVITPDSWGGNRCPEGQFLASLTPTRWQL